MNSRFRNFLFVILGLINPSLFLVFAHGQEPPLASAVHQEEKATHQTALVSLSDPAKLATLGERGANPRLKKIVYWLDQARKAGRDPGQVIDEVLRTNKYSPAHAALIKTNLLRNIKIGDELGFFTKENMGRLRRGNAPIVMNGPYANDTAEVDHIIPLSVAPEIGNDLANLELLPRLLNRKKSAKVGQRQQALAKDLNAAGVINDAVLQRILSVKTSAIQGQAETPVQGHTPSPGLVPSPDKKTSEVVIVWVNTKSHIYHMPGSRYYGTTAQGKYMKEAEAIKEGNRAGESIYDRPSTLPQP